MSETALSLHRSVADLAYIDLAHLCTYIECRQLAKPGYEIEGFILPNTLWRLQAPGPDLELPNWER